MNTQMQTALSKLSYAIMIASTGIVPAVAAVAAQPHEMLVQQASPPTTSTAIESPKRKVQTLPTIIVTANRHAQDIQSVPMSISVVSGREITQLGATDFQDYLTGIPGVSLESQGTGITPIVIRGMSTGSQSNAPTTAIYMDNQPFGSSTSYADGALLTPDVDPHDLERIEILRGPQGTLYGANSIGGLVKFVTVPPDPNHLYGDLSIGGTTLLDEGGSGFNSYGMVNAPLVSGKLAVRVSGFKRQDPGYINDVGRDKDNSNSSVTDGGRVQLLWTPSDALSVRLSAVLQNTNGDDLTSFGMSSGVEIDPVTHEPVLSPLFTVDNTKGTGLFTNHFGMYYADVNWHLGWADFVSTTSYGNLHSVQVGDLSIPFAAIANSIYGFPSDSPAGYVQQIDLDQWSQEFSLQSTKNDVLDWRVGAFYTRQRTSNHQYIVSLDASTGAPLLAPGDFLDAALSPVTFTEKALYAHAAWHVSDRLTIGAGIRANKDTTAYTQVTSGLIFGGVASEISASEHDSPVTYEFAPQFKISQNVMAYGRVASGFVSGGPNPGEPPGVGAPPTFGPEKATNYEAGIKASLLDGRATIDADIFRVDWTDIQLPATSQGFSFIANGGRARSQGAELSVAYRNGGFTLRAGGSYIDATMVTGSSADTGLYAEPGSQLPYSPRLSGNVGATYVFPLSDGWSGHLAGRVAYVDERKTDYPASVGPRFSVPSYTLVNLSGGVSKGPWEINLYVKNAGDSHGITAMLPRGADPFAAPFSATFVTPRSIGVSIDYSFSGDQ